MKRLLLLLSLLSVGGCATPYAEFYHDNLGGIDVSRDKRFADAPSEPIVSKGRDPQTDGERMAEEGYVQIGYSSFNAADVSINGAIDQAKKVHAHRVLVYSDYKNTVSGSMPLTVPNTQTSTTSVSGNAYGAGGMSTFSGTAYTTTTGTKTTYIPYSVNRYDYLATYWARRRSFVFGAGVNDLTPELRQALQTNKGVLVEVVIKGTPAFNADILKGDVLKAVGDTEIYDAASFSQVLAPHAGQTVTFQIVRNGTLIQKEVRLNPE